MLRDFGCGPPSVRSNEAMVKKIGKGGVKNAKRFRAQINYLSRNTSPFGNAVTIQRSALFFGTTLAVGRDAESRERFDAFSRGWLGNTGIYREGEDAPHQMTTHVVISWPRRQDLDEESLSAEERRSLEDNLNEVGRSHHTFPPEMRNSDDPYEKLTYLASRKWAEEQFRSCEADGFDYLTAFHSDTNHYHMHVVVNRRSRDGRSWLKIAHRYDHENQAERDAHGEKIARAEAKVAPHRLNEVGMQELRESAAEIARRDFGIPINATTRVAAGLDTPSRTDAEFRDDQRSEAGRAGSPNSLTDGAERRALRRSRRIAGYQARQAAANGGLQRPARRTPETRTATDSRRRNASGDTRQTLAASTTRKRKGVPLEQEFARIEKRARIRGEAAPSTHEMQTRNAAKPRRGPDREARKSHGRKSERGER